MRQRWPHGLLVVCSCWKTVAAEVVFDYLWPIHISKVPLSTPGVEAMEPPEFGQALAELALSGFEDYVNKTLPLELKLDADFAEEFHGADHSRVNLAFRRWQRRVYAYANRDIYPESQLSADVLEGGWQSEFLAGGWARSMPLKEVNYSWPQLRQSSEFRKLQSHISELAKLYLKRSGSSFGNKFRIFTWAEVFRKGDALRPSAHTDGGLFMGRYWPQLKKNSLKFNFEDPRGINPPFGKTHTHSIEEGAMSMFPIWASHFITPNMKSRTAVCYAFIVYPEDGNTMDFEDDGTGKFKIERVPLK
ncbi:unnamed protein product [Effrenium voratum]|uniref:Uncharacterized protein n=1 Tax=Effrenium voratum TaxID=2562239 RepID=A0AA36JTA5_9DINO|nr:unnamed protein product [Effrenium voratum]CAJ1410926.1 unnamed protein product [Effrenium voratum]CAJ1446326.1 unnamed protein product [Effrenium voratum]